MTSGSGKSKGYASPWLAPPASSVHGPDTAETSLAACALSFPLTAWRAFCTPPKQMCSVLMFASSASASVLVVLSDALVDASSPSRDVIDDSSALRLEVVTAVSYVATSTSCRSLARWASAAESAADSFLLWVRASTSVQAAAVTRPAVNSTAPVTAHRRIGRPGPCLATGRRRCRAARRHRVERRGSPADLPHRQGVERALHTSEAGLERADE